MQAVFPADWANFPLGKEAGDWQWAKHLLQAAGVMAGRFKHSAAATITGKDQAASRTGAGGPPKQFDQIVVGGGGIPDMKLHGLPGPDAVADGDHAGLGVSSDNISHQKVTPFEAVLILAGNPADMERAADQLSVVIVEGAVELLKLCESWLPAKCEDHVVFGFGDDERLADRPAALRDDRPDANVTANDDADQRRRSAG